MNSLPNYLASMQTKRNFLPIQKPAQSIQTLPIDESDFNYFNLKERTLSKISISRKRKNSNKLEMVIQKEKNNTFLSVLKNIFLPNFIGFILKCIVMKFEDHMQLDCSEDNRKFYLPSYFSLRNAIFLIYFYNWGIGLCLPFEKYQKILNTIVFFVILTIDFTLNYYGISFINLRNWSCDLILFPFAFQIIFYLFIKFCRKTMSKTELIRIGFIHIIFFMLFFDHFIIRRYLLELLYISLQKYEYNKIIFQFCLSLCYEIHGKAFQHVIKKFRKQIPKNLITFLIKYYILNVLASSSLLSIVYSEEKDVQLFAIFNFSTQIISLYMQKNIFLHSLRRLINLFKKKKEKISKSKKDDNSKIKSVIAGLTNESIYALTFALLNILIFNRTFQYSAFDDEREKIKKFKMFCSMNFDKLVTFTPENLCLMFIINFFYFLYLLFKLRADKNIKFLYKKENYSLPIRIFSVILFQGNADTNFQFYMHLNFLDRNKELNNN